MYGERMSSNKNTVVSRTLSPMDRLIASPGPLPRAQTLGTPALKSLAIVSRWSPPAAGGKVAPVTPPSSPEEASLFGRGKTIPPAAWILSSSPLLSGLWSRERAAPPGEGVRRDSRKQPESPTFATVSRRPVRTAAHRVVPLRVQSPATPATRSRCNRWQLRLNIARQGVLRRKSGRVERVWLRRRWFLGDMS